MRVTFSRLLAVALWYDWMSEILFNKAAVLTVGFSFCTVTAYALQSIYHSRAVLYSAFHFGSDKEASWQIKTRPSFKLILFIAPGEDFQSALPSQIVKSNAHAIHGGPEVLSLWTPHQYLVCCYRQQSFVKILCTYSLTSSLLL